MHEITKYYLEGFQEAITRRKRFTGRRIGSELKFPFVKNNGYAAHKDDVEYLWEYLGEHGWRVLTDPVTGRRIGAELPGEFNNTVARSETGHSLIEFSLAHAGTLHELQKAYDDLRSILSGFSVATETWLLSFGMHPVEKPGKHLMTSKSRNMFWETMFGSNRIVPPDEGSDVHLFALSAAHQVHIDIEPEESVKAVNVLNGFAGAQIALTANSNIWQNGVADRAQCLGELFWDWWLGDQRDRAGVPERRFDSLDDYAECIGGYSPVFVRRDDRVIGLRGYDTFKEYYRGEETKAGIDADGCRVNITPMKEDISLHNTFFWHDARISRYFTVENRLNDQQPYDEMIVVPALTLGLIENLDEAHEYISQFDWETIRTMRDKAIHTGMDTSVDGTAVIDQCKDMLIIAERGLAQRGSGEERYMEPLRHRLQQKRNPALEAAELFRREGLEQFIREVRIGSVS